MKTGLYLNENHEQSHITSQQKQSEHPDHLKKILSAQSCFIAKTKDEEGGWKCLYLQTANKHMVAAPSLGTTV